MQKLKQYIEKIEKNKIINNIINILWNVLCTFFFLKMVLNLGYVSESLYQTHRDYFLGVAVSFFLLAVLFLQRVKMKNIWVYIFTAVYFVVATQWLKANELNWGEELQNVYKMRWICGGLLGISLIDAIRYKKVILLKNRNVFLSGIFLVATLLACIISGLNYYSYILLLPFAYFYSLEFKSKDWKKWIFCFTAGYYISFVYTIIKSFQTVPYTGERYYGIYINHGMFGIMIGGAFVCALWWVIVAFRKKASVWIRAIVFIPTIFCFVCLIMNGARVAELAVIVTLIVVLCLWGGKETKEKIMYRVAFVLIGMVIAIVGGVTILAIFNKYDEETMELFIQNDVLRQKIMYWWQRADTLFNAESIYGVFEEGSIMNALDRFSSSRLSIFTTYLRDFNLFGHDNLYVQLKDVAVLHPHNTFIYWLYGLGVVPGMFLIIWVVSNIITAIRKALRQDEIYIISFLWVVYFSIASLNEDIFFSYIVGFCLLILHYPLLVNMKNQD